MLTKRFWALAVCSIAGATGLLCGPANSPATAGGSETAPSTRAAAPLGANVSLQLVQLLPPDNAWNRDISQDPVDAHSDLLIDSIGRKKSIHPDFGTAINGAPWGIAYCVVGKGQPRVAVKFETKDESDPGPYPIPLDAPIEGGPTADGDRHVIVLDRDDGLLYELERGFAVDGGKSWKALSGAVFDVRSGKPRPAGWTSADAAGLPILPGLIRYDEIERGEITHAIRFTAERTRHAYVAPALHFASPHRETNLPPMGARVRLKREVDLSTFPPSAKIILTAMKKYGMILADNGGNWFFDGAPDLRWNDEEIDTLKRIKGDDLEVVRMGDIVTR